MSAPPLLGTNADIHERALIEHPLKDGKPDDAPTGRFEHEASGIARQAAAEKLGDLDRAASATR